MTRSYAEINEKIRRGRITVLTAEEVLDVVEKKGVKKAAAEVDVVTTGTFGPMCSSGAFLSVPDVSPKIKIRKAWLNKVPAYAGLAAMDLYIGATEIPESAREDPPKKFTYGGGYVISELAGGKDVTLRATGYGTDCYPRRELTKFVNIRSLNTAILANPRNVYQNYNVAVNTSGRRLRTYMGTLEPRLGSARYSSSGQLSPLLNDPYLRTVGVGTRIFLAGADGYVFSAGTRHNPSVRRTKGGIPLLPAATLAVTGDMKKMSGEWLRGIAIAGYGVSLIVGIALPIPILDEEMMKFVSVKDEDIYTCVVDYACDYPEGKEKIVAEVNYRDLRSGIVSIGGNKVNTGSFSSYGKAREIAEILKKKIEQGEFFLTEPAARL